MRSDRRRFLEREPVPDGTNRRRPAPGPSAIVARPATRMVPPVAPRSLGLARRCILVLAALGVLRKPPRTLPQRDPVGAGGHGDRSRAGSPRPVVSKPVRCEALPSDARAASKCPTLSVDLKQRSCRRTGVSRHDCLGPCWCGRCKRKR